MPEARRHHHEHSHSHTALIFAALGIVFGDIGTSPLYTIKTIIILAGGMPTPADLLGFLSLVIWALILIPTIKYVSFVMRIDNQGEGGILALMSLLSKDKDRPRNLIIMLGLFGAALIYGDGVVTPAISVLSAVEGLKIAFPHLSHYVLPISCATLLLLFGLQYQGTARIGWIYGPIMALWFLTLGALGVWGIVQHPAVLQALSPYHAVHYLMSHGHAGFMVLGGVFLAVTGSEAIYADMGHIGAKPIRRAWSGLVLPALLLNYAGQTGLIIDGGSPVDNGFYRLCPDMLLVPLIILSTIATIIASQAMITGAFSMTRQAIQLGWCPRLRVTQTSAGGIGQIYVPIVNWMLMTVCLALALSFGSSDNLAAAYGIAVSMTMMLTTILMFIAMHEIWKWNLTLCTLTAGSFILIDMVFFSANFTKVLEGGWVPLLVAITIFCLMLIWHRGYTAMLFAIREKSTPVSEVVAGLEANNVVRVPGTAVFLTRTSGRTPHLIQWHVTRNHCLYEKVVALAVITEQTPWVEKENRIVIEKYAHNFWRVVAHYGFMERPNIPLLMHQVHKLLPDIDIDHLNYYVGRETILVRHVGRDGMPLWQETIYAFMQRNSAHIGEYFKLPPDNVMEIGRQVEI